MRSLLGVLLPISLLLTACSSDASQSQPSQNPEHNVTQSKAKILTPPKNNGHFFVLHRFNDNKHASTSITNKNLIRHFEYLKKHNYYVASMPEIIARLKNGEDIPNDWVHFCIDDSYKSFYANGFPLFKKYGYPFTLYVYVEATERHFHDFMSWDQIKEVMPYGEIGLHSWGHDHMTHLTDEQMREDTRKALDMIEKRLGVRPTTYAYPYGEYNEELQKIVKEFQFDLIMNQNQGAFSNVSPVDDLDRIALTGDVNIKHKLAIKYLPAVWQKVDVDYDAKVLRSIELTIDPRFKSVQCYISGDKWHTLKPKKGKITQKFDIKLKKSRTRIIIKTPDNRWSSKIIVL